MSFPFPSVKSYNSLFFDQDARGPLGGLGTDTTLTASQHDCQTLFQHNSLLVAHHVGLKTVGDVGGDLEDERLVAAGSGLGSPNPAGADGWLKWYCIAGCRPQAPTQTNEARESCSTFARCRLRRPLSSRPFTQGECCVLISCLCERRHLTIIPAKCLVVSSSS